MWYVAAFASYTNILINTHTYSHGIAAFIRHCDFFFSRKNYKFFTLFLLDKFIIIDQKKLKDHQKCLNYIHKFKSNFSKKKSLLVDSFLIKKKKEKEIEFKLKKKEKEKKNMQKGIYKK